MRYDWLLLDADGTLFDYDRAEAAALTLTLEGLGVSPTPDHLTRYRGFNSALWAALERGEVTREKLRSERFRLLFDAFGIDADPVVFNAQYLEHLGQRGDLLDGAEAVLGRLFGRTRMALLTNGFAEVQRTRLDHSGLGRFFEVVIISDEVGFAKPDPRIYDASFEAMGNPSKASVLMVGDSLTSDMQGGMNYNIDTCWFNPNGKPNTLDRDPTFEIRSLDELAKLVQG